MDTILSSSIKKKISKRTKRENWKLLRHNYLSYRLICHVCCHPKGIIWPANLKNSFLFPLFERAILVKSGLGLGQKE